MPAVVDIYNKVFDGIDKLKVAVTGGGAGGTSNQDNAAFTAGADFGTAAMGLYQAVISAVTSGRAGAFAMTAYRGIHANLRRSDGNEQGAEESGTVWIGSTAYPVKRFFSNVAAAQTDASLVTAVATKKLRVLSYRLLTGATATTFTFNSKGVGAGTAADMAHQNAGNGGAVVPHNLHGWFETNAGEALTCTTGAGSTTGVAGTYIEV